MYSASEKLAIIRLVEDSELSICRTLVEINVSRSSFYRWYQAYERAGPDGLKPRICKKQIPIPNPRFHNRLKLLGKDQDFYSSVLRSAFRIVRAIFFLIWGYWLGFP